ncbi:MAG TPA: hypothetical protein QGH10_12250, partial [Armatimonadota bacterium]|nr:hypothetical protein [Armatimonadota bacterium]
RSCERFGAERLLFGNGLPEYDPGGAVATVVPPRKSVQPWNWGFRTYADQYWDLTPRHRRPVSAPAH